MGYGGINEMWCDTVSTLLYKGARVSSRNGPALELLGMHESLDCPWNSLVTVPGRKLSATYAAAELLWYLSGDPRGEMITAYAPSYSRFLEGDGTAHGAYGARWAKDPAIITECGHPVHQLSEALELLAEDHGTRQAVVTMWNAGDLVHARRHDRKDLPCTLSMQFLRRHDELHLLVTMRSNDVWLGFPYDVFCFTSIQQLMASALGIALGRYTHSVGSMHLYESDVSRMSSTGVQLVADALPESECPVYCNSWASPGSPPSTLAEACIAACAFERQMRNNEIDAVQLMHNAKNLSMVSSLLADCVLACATKWCNPKQRAELLKQIEWTNLAVLLARQFAKEDNHASDRRD